MNKVYLLALCFSLKAFMIYGQWRKMPVSGGGYASALDKDGDHLFALSRTSIYQSDDEGIHWHELEESSVSAADLLTFQAENGVFYSKDFYGKMLQSKDGGKSWQPIVVNALLGFPGEKLLNVFAKEDTVLITSTHTIYRSVDKGLNWEVTGDLFGAELSKVFSLNGECFAWGGRYVYRSSDGARTWEKVFSIAGEFGTIDVVDNKICALYKAMQKLVITDDGFRSWKSIYTDSIQCYVGFAAPWYVQITGKGNDLYCFYSVAFDFFECDVFMSYSNDGGETWFRKNNGRQIALNINQVETYGDHMVFAHDSGIDYSVDGAETFNAAQHGFQNSSITKLSQSGPDIFVTTSYSNFVSADDGVTWNEIIAPSSRLHCEPGFELHATNQSWLLFDYYSTKYMRSTDRGITWRTYSQQLNSACVSSENGHWVMDYAELIKIPDDDTVFSKITLWTLFKGAAVSITPFKEGVIVKGTDGDYFSFYENGYTIHHFPAPPCQPLFPTTDIDITVYQGNDLYYFCGPYGYYFEENGKEWEETNPQDWSTGIPFSVTGVTFIKEHEGILWAGIREKGLYFSTDKGRRFFPFEPQLPHPFPKDILFRNNEVWVTTELEGVFVHPLSKVIAESRTVSALEISPNPSNGALRLRSNVFLTEMPTLNILDGAGRKVVEELLPPGQAWDFSFSQLPQGIYFIQVLSSKSVSAGKWVIQNKM